jgi:uncharacterized membrane protein
MLAGLLMVLPFVVTGWIVVWLYRFFETAAIRPTARLVVTIVEGQTGAALPPWFTHFVAPLIGVLGVLGSLYFLGFIARSRAEHALDALLLRVPVVTSVHKAVRQLFGALSGSNELKRFERVVLVEFPHPGMRVPAFVTAYCRDTSTGKTILCVYVPTTPMPTSGYMILVPEEKVTDLDWPVDQTVQAVVSFGITAPDKVRYYVDGGPARDLSGTGPDSPPPPG